MVLGLVAALGVGLAGYGIYKGSRDAGKAVKGVGQGAEGFLHTISKEVTQMRVFLTETAWPEVNKTIVRLREVLDSVDELLVTSTFTVKVLALFLALCAAYMTHKLISARMLVWNRRRNAVAISIEDTVLQILYCLCVVLAIVLVFHLVKEVFHITWPHSTSFVVVIPSLALIYQHLVIALKTICTLLRFIPYVMIEFPVNMGLDPVTKGSCYMMGFLLPLWMCVIFLLLYSLVPYGAYLVLVYLTESEESVLKCLLIGYGVFYAATIAINVVGAIILMYFVRPVWAFLARQNLRH